MAQKLLNDDGTASMATMIMSSHHGFRRDLACFARALTDAARDDGALHDEWKNFRGALHGHHEHEDGGMFPMMRAHAELAPTIDQLSAEHREIDPLLERGDHAFAARDRSAAREVITALTALLTPHLDLEERTLIPLLRDAKQFPPPPDESLLALYADGFAWSTAGLAPEVCEAIDAMLPEALRTKIPAARAAYEARCRRVWGAAHAGASTTSVP